MDMQKRRIFRPKSKMEMPKSNIILDLSQKYAAKKMPKSIILYRLLSVMERRDAKEKIFGLGCKMERQKIIRVYID